MKSSAHHLSRRQLLGTALSGAAALWNEQRLHAADADPRVRGPFPILSTPFTESGAVDYEVLANQARFVDWGGCPGMIWPQSGDSVDLLTMEEKLRGMEVLAETSRSFKTSALCLGVQGRDTAEMLVYARHAEKLAPAAIISRPPDSGRTEEDLRQYWRALAEVAQRPVIFQTTGGVAYKGPVPSVKLMIELAKEFPHFGYIKEEAAPIIARTRELCAAKPVIRRVFSARGAHGWLFESHLGTEGLITERAVYADVLTRLWQLMDSGQDADTVRDIHAKLLLLFNLGQHLPGGDLRGFQLHLWKKRGVFKNMISRQYGPGRSIPDKPIFAELALTADEIAEIDFRFETLRPYLKPNPPRFDAATR
ncbi:dihydrodipicolinate synthase family protein [Prosthecobacter fluviatilis]|uniref:Dihydrodipicolinate synthase family protein n=1 Tax=Prosthecobacter fluviatilis TaxID=445931 RepID=A0ABW0KNE5_9BACT